VEETTVTPSSDPSGVEPRFGRAGGRLFALAAATAIALAAAGPALAGDDPTPVPTLPEPPAAEATETLPLQPGLDPLSLPAPPDPSLPELDDSPVTVAVTEGESGSIDVSVRVLSPDEDGATQEQGVEPSVVSPPPTADITDELGPTLSATEEGATAPAAGANVNVSLRVLSPGTDGPVDQIGTRDPGGDGLATAGPALEPPETDEAHPGSVPVGPAGDDGVDSTSLENPEQYHDENSRYQSELQSNPAPWNWTWYLTLDCGGNLVSESEETGTQSSLDWVWEWAWEWSCNNPPRPPPLDTAAAGLANEPSQSAPTAGSEGTPRATEQGSEGDSEDEPWSWTWTFTFCGETVTATMPISTESALAWQWDWIWNWTCEPEASEPGPSAPDVSSPAPSVQTPEPSGTTQGAGEPGPSLDSVAFPTWVISLLPVAELFPLPRTEHVALATTVETGAIEVAVELEIALPSPSEPVPALLDTEVGAPAILAPSMSPHRPEHSGGVPAPDHVRPARRDGAGAGTPEASAGATSSRPRHPGTATTSKQRGGSRSTRRSPSSPPGLPPLQTTRSSGASSSFVPSGSVLGTAALVALFILAAPALGRRIRVAPELRPRGTHGSSIDHPG
jgi:hypothetical protein